MSDTQSMTSNVRMEELPPIPENAPLPNMITLYSRDLYYASHFTSEERLFYLHNFDPEQRQAFTESCLWLVIRIVQSIINNIPRFEKHRMDLTQEGNMGLLNAIEHAPLQPPFESVLSFHRYAACYIRGAIYESYNHIPLIYIPRSSRRRAYAKDREKAKEVFDAIQEEVSLEALFEDFEFDIIDPTAFQRHIDRRKQERVDRLLDCLQANERRVVILHYGLQDGIEHHFREVAEIMGMYFSSVRRLHVSALQRMSGELHRPIRARMAQESEARIYQLLSEWQKKGIKITVNRVRKEVKCNGQLVQNILREQGLLQRQGRKQQKGTGHVDSP